MTCDRRRSPDQGAPTRRAVLGGAGAVMIVGGARAARDSRSALPGGGSVLIRAPYRPALATDYFHVPGVDALVAYRNRRYRASGNAECDGMIAVARSERAAEIEAFEMNARAALTTSWAFAGERPAPWGDDRGSIPLEEAEGPGGREAIRELALHLVGIFGTYSKPARFCAVERRIGLKIGVWIFESHGGVARAKARRRDSRLIRALTVDCYRRAIVKPSG